MIVPYVLVAIIGLANPEDYNDGLSVFQITALPGVTFANYKPKCNHDVPWSVHSEEISGKCIAFVTSPKREYEDAEKYCEKYGGTLAILNSEDMKNDVANALRRYREPTIRFWIGLSDINHENVFVWEDGTQFEGELTRSRSSSHKENCVALSESGSLFVYNCQGSIKFDFRRQHGLHFICQFKLPPTTTTITTTTQTTESTTTTTTEPTTTTAMPTTTVITTTEPSTTTTTTTKVTTTTTTTLQPTTTSTEPTTITTTTPEPPTTTTGKTTTSEVTHEETTQSCQTLSCDNDCGLAGYKTDAKGCLTCNCDE